MTPTKRMDDYLGIEGRMQKWRKLTPIGLVINLMASIGGMGLVGWFAVHLITSFDQEIKSINNKIDNSNVTILQRIDSYAEKESDDVLRLTQKQSDDVLALTQKIYTCCRVK